MTGTETFWQPIIVAVLASGGVSAIVVKVLDIFKAKADLKNKNKEQTDEFQGARDTILTYVAGNLLSQIMCSCIHEKYMDIATRRSCDSLHRAYKKLGGNGIIDTLWEQIQTLPMEKPENNKEGD